MSDLPTHARAVVIGGGIIGCSVAYHLSQLGWSDVVLLERKQLTSGTTWHAAGLIAQLRATFSMTKLARYSADLYARLEDETGVATGYKRNGSLALALTKERLEEFARGASMAKNLGIAAELLTVEECASACPLVDVGGATGGLLLPEDGQADPANVALALAKGARNGGVRIFEHTRVTKVQVEAGRVVSVHTERGPIATDIVVNAAGMWAPDVGRMAGVSVPLHACEHFYLVTDSIAGLARDLPVLRVPDECAYYKEDAGKMLLGVFEPKAKPWGMDGIPPEFCFDQLPEDFDHLAPIIEAAVRRVPVLETVGIHTFFNGPESFTPDDRYLLGEAPEVRNYFVAAGFNSVGIQSAGGAGKALAEWMDVGEPPFDLWEVDIRRMQPFQSNRSYLYHRSTETLGLLYADHFPYRQFATARGIRRTPLHERMASRGACFGELAGWERANWFLPSDQLETGEVPEYEYSWGRQNWFAYASGEHLAVRQGVGLFDMSTFVKIRVEGRDAEAFLQRVCANDVAVDPGRIVYTQWLNHRGCIEADLTVTRLSETLFLVITAAANAVREMSWLRRNMPEGLHCVLTDVTSGEAVVALMGPNARTVLEAVANEDLSTSSFPFATARTIEVGMGLARAHRITYVGELGWEIYASADMAVHVFDAICEAGEAHGIRLCGMHALDSCRIEKAFRHFGHDITDEDHVLEAGLGFAVKTEKEPGKLGHFMGRDAVLRRKEQGLSRRLVQFQLKDPDPMLYHNEPIWRDSTLAGYITSGNYGHYLGAAIGLGYVACDPSETASDLLSSTYDIEVGGVRCRATASLRPLYDPKSERMRA